MSVAYTALERATEALTAGAEIAARDMVAQGAQIIFDEPRLLAKAFRFFDPSGVPLDEISRLVDEALERELRLSKARAFIADYHALIALRQAKAAMQMPGFAERWEAAAKAVRGGAS